MLGGGLWCSVILIFLSPDMRLLYTKTVVIRWLLQSTVWGLNLVFSLFKREKYLTSKPAWCLYLSEYFSEIEIRMKSCHSFGQKKTVYYKEADILWTNVGNNRLWSNSQTQMRHYQYTSYIGEKEITEYFSSIEVFSQFLGVSLQYTLGHYVRSEVWRGK